MIAAADLDDRAIPSPRNWTTAKFVRAIQIAACVAVAASSLPASAVESAHPLSTHDSEYLSLLDEARFDELRRKASMGVANGDPVAKAFLAQLYIRGLGVAADKQRAIGFLEECASQGNPLCKTWLGRAIAMGNDNPEVRKRTVKLVSEAAETGHPIAVVNLGILYELGIGVEKNYELSFKYYELARGAGLQSATARLGWLYRQGKGVSRSEGTAKSLFREAAKAGSPSGMVGHAFSYFNEGKPAKALKFLDVPIKLKYSDAEALAGHIWVFGGKKVHRNYARGMRLLHEAAEKNHTYALRDLGKIYERGIGVPASRRLAADWYYKGGIAAAKREDREFAISCLEDLERVGGGSSMVADLRSKIPGGVDVPAPGNEQAVVASSGTGWVSPEGFIVTANHVVAGHNRVAVLLSGGKEVGAKVVVADSANDIALLSIDNPKLLPPGLPIAGNSASLGARVWTIGYPLTDIMGDSQKLTDGVVSSVTGFRNDPRLYQISVPVQAGNSGGPLLNMEGEVVGIVTAKLSAVKVFLDVGDLPQGVNYAIKGDYLRLVMSTTRPVRSPRSTGHAGADLERLAQRVQPSVVRVLSK